MEKIIRDLRKLQKRLPNRRDVNVIKRAIRELNQSLPDRCMSASVHHTPAGKVAAAQRNGTPVKGLIQVCRHI